MKPIASSLGKHQPSKKKGEKKARILGAARALMYEKGYNNFSLRAVAKASGYSPAGLYEHFENKAALCSALAEDAWSRLGKSVRLAAQNEKDPFMRLIILCETYVTFATKYREDFLLLFSSLPSPRSAHNQQIPEGSAMAIFLDAVAEAADADVIDAKTPSERLTIFYGLWSIAHGVAHLQTAHLAEFEDDFTEDNRSIFQALITGFINK